MSAEKADPKPVGRVGGKIGLAFDEDKAKRSLLELKAKLEGLHAAVGSNMAPSKDELSATWRTAAIDLWCWQRRGGFGWSAAMFHPKTTPVLLPHASTRWWKSIANRMYQMLQSEKRNSCSVTAHWAAEQQTAVRAVS